MARIGIIGCGNMGTAIIKAVYSLQFTVYGYDADKKKLRDIAKKYKVKTASKNTELVKKCNVIILAVKPQNIREVLREIKNTLDSSKLLISVAAGISTKRIEREIGKKIAVIRVMPNMPTLIQAGVSAICKGRFAAKKDLGAAKKIFAKIGDIVEVKENLMDAVTAISGSGPAYFFYLIEVLIKSGIELGLNKEIARRLAVETALGSAKILKEIKESPENLRAKVTSKGGTTEAAFNEFFKHDLEVILKRGIRKAFDKARRL